MPILLLFLAVRMLFGSDGVEISFENIAVAQIIGTVSLCIILFSEMDTKIDDIRPVIPQGIILSAVGVLLTAALTGIAVWWIFDKTLMSAGIGIVTSLLLAATMSLTDSAFVFSILRSKGLVLKHAYIIEWESGSNAPMAYVLTVTLIGIVKVFGDVNYLQASSIVIKQLIIGAAMGFMLGKLMVWGIKVPGLLISFVMIILTRPLSVFVCLLPFRKMRWKDKTFVSWVGLRGALSLSSLPYSRWQRAYLIQGLF